MPDLIERRSPALMELVDPALGDALRAASVLVKYVDGQIIHSRGDKKPGLSIVKSGAVRVGTIGLDGSFQTVSVLGVGQSFGEHTVLAGLPRTHDVSAAGSAEIYQMTAPVFMRLVEAHAELTSILLKVSLIRSHGLLEQIDDMRRLTLPVRLAKLLMSIRGEVAEGRARVTCRQSELAYTLGVSRVALGNAVKRLTKTGLIVPGYGYVTIMDIGRLSGWVAAQSKIAPLDVAT